MSMVFDYQFISLLSLTFLILGLGGFVLRNNVKEKTNIFFFFLTLFLSVWTFSLLLLLSYSGGSIALLMFLGRLPFIAIVLAVWALIYFSFYFPDNKTSIKFVHHIAINAFASLIFLLSFTNVIIKSTFYNQYGELDKDYGILFPFFILFLVVFLVLSIANFGLKYIHSSGVQRLRIKYVFAGIILTIILASFTNLILPLLGIQSLYVFGPYSILAIFLSTSYAILQYRLFDLNVQIQKVFNYILPLIAVVIIALILGFFTHRYLNENAYFIGALIVVISSLLFKFLFTSISKTTFGHALFKSTYQYQQALIKLADEASTLLDLEVLAKRIVQVFVEYVGVDKIIIITNTTEVNKFSVLSAVPSLSGEKDDYNDVPLIFLDYLQTTNEPLLRDELRFKIRNSGDKKEVQVLKRFLKIMIGNNVALCLPLMLHETLIGIIFLGKKDKGRAYTMEDITILKDLSSELAIAMANSMLHQTKMKQAFLLKKEVDEQTRKIKELYEMKSNFLTVASHQLRTPTSIVRGMLSMLVEDDDVPEDRKNEIITGAFKASGNLERVIEDILTAAEIDSAKFDFEPKPVDIIPVVKKVVDDLLLKAEKKNLTLEFTEPRYKKALAMTDAIKIEQVFVNLVDNALNYTSEGGVTVRIAKKKEKGIDYYVFSCSDTGVGMTADDIKKIGEKFFRSKNVFSVHPNGTGLGIYIVERVLKCSNGKLVVESKGLGKGATFNVYLPAAGK
ncbi:hypothetical protein KKH43_00570 [Patescibacteria group bacterium]|nr:hypothetical protein [Patescibacteria group bacterium]